MAKIQQSIGQKVPVIIEPIPIHRGLHLFAPKKLTKLTNKTAAISFDETIKPSFVLDIPKTFSNVGRFTATNPLMNKPKINKTYKIKAARIMMQLGVFRKLPKVYDIAFFIKDI